MLRDDAALNLGVTLDYRRLIQNTRVRLSEGRRSLCYGETELDSLKDMFRQRAKLHRSVCCVVYGGSLRQVMIFVITGTDIRRTQ